MADADDTGAFLESLTAAFACRSWFCRDRGPFIVATLDAAERLAAKHRQQPRWLGFWPHDVVAYRLTPEQLEAGRKFAEFMRRLRQNADESGVTPRECQPNDPSAAQGQARAMANIERGFRRLTLVISLLLSLPFALMAWSDPGDVRRLWCVLAVVGFVMPWVIFLIVRWIVKGFRAAS